MGVDVPYQLPDGKHEEYFESGERFREFSLKDGLYDGVEREWVKPGELQYERTWSMGLLDGPARRVGDELLGPSEGRWDHGHLVEYTEWNTNGQVIRTVETLPDGSQRNSWYYDNGSLRLQGIMIEGEREGIWKEWTEDGTIESTKTYDHGVRVH